MKKLLSSLAMAALIFTSVFSSVAVAGPDIPDEFYKFAQAPEKLKTEEIEKMEDWMQEQLRETRGRLTGELSRIQHIIDAAKEGNGGRGGNNGGGNTGGDDKCPSNQPPDLWVDNVTLNGVNDDLNAGNLYYDFSLTMRNQNSSQMSFGPLNVSNMSIGVYDNTKMNSVDLQNANYGDLAQFQVAELLVTDNGAPIVLGCGEWIKFDGLSVSIPKTVNEKNLLFVLDSKNQVQELSEPANQNAGSNIAWNDNNFWQFSLAQPFKSFQPTTSGYNNSSKIATFSTSFNYMGSDVEERLKTLGYSFVTEVWDIDGSGFLHDGFPSEVINDPGYQVQYLVNAINPNFDFSSSSLLASLPMTHNGSLWQSEGEFNMDAGQNHFAVLSIVAPSGEKYPVQGMKAVDLSGVWNDNDYSYQECDFAAGECDYFVFERKSPDNIMAGDGINEANPQLSSEFEGCNKGSSVATVQSFKFKMWSGAGNGQEYIYPGAEIHNKFYVNDQALKRPQFFQGSPWKQQKLLRGRF